MKIKVISIMAIIFGKLKCGENMAES